MPWWRFIPCGKHYRDPHRSSLKTVAGEVQNLHRVSHEHGVFPEIGLPESHILGNSASHQDPCRDFDGQTPDERDRFAAGVEFLLLLLGP